MKQVGIYSGSFNPIHIGHLALANYLCEYEKFDEIWFVVSPNNPWKKEEELLPDKFRLKMVRLSIEGYPRFRASDIEFHLPQPSYTVHTLDSLKKTYPEIHFSLIIGADNWKKFDQWKDWQYIVNKYDLYVYPRNGYSIDPNSKIPPGVHIVHSPLLDISSTFIREALQQHHDIRFFVHPNTWQLLRNYYIKE